MNDNETFTNYNNISSFLRDLNIIDCKYLLFNNKNNTFAKVPLIIRIAVMWFPSELLKKYQQHNLTPNTDNDSNNLTLLFNEVHVQIFLYKEIFMNILFSKKSCPHIFIRDFLFPVTENVFGVQCLLPPTDQTGNRFDSTTLSRSSPALLFLTLCIGTNNNAQIDIWDEEVEIFSHRYINNTLVCNNKYLCILNNVLVYSDSICTDFHEWNIVPYKEYQYIIESKNNGMFVSVDTNYNLSMSQNKCKACVFYINSFKEGITFNYIKSKHTVQMETVMNTHISTQLEYVICDKDRIVNNKKKNYAILLASGIGQRYSNKKLKQLVELDDKPIMYYSIKVFEECNDIDVILVMTNTKCCDIVKNIVQTNHFSKVIVISADTDSRDNTIIAAYEYIKNNTSNNVENILLHDAARPLIESKHVTQLFDVMNDCDYATYYIILKNGLIHKNMNIYDNILNKSDYVEICSPQCIKYNIFSHIHDVYKNTSSITEYIPHLQVLQKKIILLEGSQIDLHKLTYKDDLTIIKTFYNFKIANKLCDNTL
jgi:2-C-methyl-D-erythritol 4-phosphate cytidylyltransferase